MDQKLGWGIMGTGNIAGQFATDVVGSSRCLLKAAGSRSAKKAAEFARTHSIPASHGSYDGLLADPTVDAVYISLPNAMHHEWTLKALAKGKHVLCEKPLATNTAQSQEMFDAARRTKLVLIEAFMYRSHPLTAAVLKKVGSGAIGNLRMIRTNFCFCTSEIETNVRFSTELAGGGLMDVGCYCVNFCRAIAQSEPIAVHGVAHLHESGVDDFAAGAMEFPGGVLACFTCGMRVEADNTVSICGDCGYIEIPVPWKPPVNGAEFVVGHSAPPRMDRTPDASPPRQSFQVDAGKPLYALEADDFAATVLDGAPARVSEQDTLGNMRVLDELRRQVGVPF